MKDKLESDKLKASVKTQASRIRKAEEERHRILADMVYLGTLGVIFVLPVVVGAYLGMWLDSRMKGYSFSWTIALIVIGVFVGASDVYFFLRRR
jgi:ATP synthase protein I